MIHLMLRTILEVFGKGKCINALIHFESPVMAGIKAPLHPMFGVVGRKLANLRRLFADITPKLHSVERYSGDARISLVQCQPQIVARGSYAQHSTASRDESAA